MASNPRSGERAPRAKLTEVQAAEIIRRALNGERNRALAREYSIGESTVGKLVRGHTWHGLDSDRRKEKKQTGTHHHLAKLDAEKVRAIRKAYAEGKTYLELATKYCVTTSPIYNIVRGITWKHVI